MDMSSTASNEDLRNAIERLAVFVAKNGPDFEKMTMEKQEGNPKFAFLYGGPYNEYYRFCVEREVQKRPPQPESEFMRRMNSQKEQLRQQITDSERNLKAHLDSIPAMKEAQVAQAVVMSESQKMSQILANVNFDVAPLGAILDQLNGGKCSKDLVSTSRKWIFEHCQTDQLREVVLTYLLSRVKDSHANDNFRLNILYVINDWAYQCQRKRLDSQTQMLSRYVPQMYAFTVELSQDGMMQQKLDKLIGVWEGHKYFNDQCFK
ncbi:surp module, partial [Ostertagia ostertagi]